MPRTLTAAATLEKNLLTSGKPFILLLTVATGTDAWGTVRITSHAEDVTYGGEVFAAYPFEIDAATQALEGDIPELALRFANASGAIGQMLDDTNGGKDVEVTLQVALLDPSNTRPAAVSEVLLTETYDIVKAAYSGETAVVTLGAPNVIAQRFPLRMFLPADFPSVPASQ